MGGVCVKKIALVLLMSLCLGSTAFAGDKFSLDVEVDYTTRYIWRGMDLIPDNHAAVQPWFNVSYAITDKLTVNYLGWGDYRLIDGSDSDVIDNDWDEFDHVPYLTFTLNDAVNFELGYIYYYLPSSVNNDQEFYGGVNLALADNLSTSLYVYYNFDSGSADGVYAKWALDFSEPLSEWATFNAGAVVGYMNYDDGFDDGFADLPLSAGVTIDLGHDLTMSVTANYSVTLEALRDNDLNHENEFWILTGLSYSM